jgi:hypothetical protein
MSRHNDLLSDTRTLCPILGRYTYSRRESEFDSHASKTRLCSRHVRELGERNFGSDRCLRLRTRVASWSAPLRIASRAASSLSSSVSNPAPRRRRACLRGSARSNAAVIANARLRRPSVCGRWLSPERPNGTTLVTSDAGLSLQTAQCRFFEGWSRGPRRSWWNWSPPAPARHTDRPKTLRSRLAPRPRMRRRHRRR